MGGRDTDTECSASWELYYGNGNYIFRCDSISTSTEVRKSLLFVSHYCLKDISYTKLTLLLKPVSHGLKDIRTLG